MSIKENLSEQLNNAGSFVSKWLKRMALMLLFLVVGLVLFLYYGTYSEGVRAGKIVKVSKKGVVFKTWEGQLDIQSFGAVKSDNQLSQTFEFSIYSDQPELIKELEDAALVGDRVNIRYEEKYAVLLWRGSTKYFATGVERMPIE